MQKRLRYSEFVDDINVTAFEEAIGFVTEYERGDNDVGFCLWPENHSHGDTTGKFAIHREDKIYNCYVCGGGTLLSLAMETQGFTDVDDATAWLHQFCEEDLRSDSDFVDDFMDAFADVEKRVESLPFFNDRVLDNFSDPLEEAMEWVDGHWVPFLTNRCILPEIAAQAGVRYKEEITRKPPQKGKFADDDPYTGPGIIFPHTWKGRLVGWQTRWLDPDRPDWLPKYTNTSDFPRETTIYGWDIFNDYFAHDAFTVVVESAPSSLFVQSCGYASVATFGSNVNDAQLRLLRRLPNVILAPDHDVPKDSAKLGAGMKWRNHLADYLKPYTRVWFLPLLKAGTDIGDLAKADDPGQAVDHLLAHKYEPGISL